VLYGEESVKVKATLRLKSQFFETYCWVVGVLCCLAVRNGAAMNGHKKVAHYSYFQCTKMKTRISTRMEKIVRQILKSLLIPPCWNMTIHTCKHADSAMSCPEMSRSSLWWIDKPTVSGQVDVTTASVLPRCWQRRRCNGSWPWYC
jgi:hypothetical protein